MLISRIFSFLLTQLLSPWHELPPRPFPKNMTLGGQHSYDRDPESNVALRTRSQFSPATIMKGQQNARSRGSGYTSHLPKTWKPPDPEDPDGCGRRTSNKSARKRKKKNLRKSEGLATPGKDLSIGGGVVREDTIPESAGKTEQWARENERTLDPSMDPNRSPRVEMQS